MQRLMIERCNPLSTDLWVKPQTNGFHDFILLYSILLQMDRLQLTAGPLQPTGGVKTTPQKTRFRSVNKLEGIHIQVKSEFVGTLMTTELMTQSRTTSTTTYLMWPQS